jgi:hypothetical protein
MAGRNLASPLTGATTGTAGAGAGGTMDGALVYAQYRAAARTHAMIRA